MKDGNTRVFFVVDSPLNNEELYETLEEAEQHASMLDEPRVRVCLVKNAYKEHSYLENASVWNYEDRADTFHTIKELTQ